MTRPFRLFLVVSGVLVLGSIGWAWLRWSRAAPERAAWTAVQRDLEIQSARIDSLKWALSHLETELAADKRAIASAAERLAHIRREAVNGALPEAEHRRYEREVERHDEAVASHNLELAALKRAEQRFDGLQLAVAELLFQSRPFVRRNGQPAGNVLQLAARIVEEG